MTISRSVLLRKRSVAGESCRENEKEHFIGGKEESQLDATITVY